MCASDCSGSFFPNAERSLTDDRRQPTVDRYAADLHVHTLLSPCGEIEMIPSLIIEMAQMAGLDIIGIADHNSSENAGAVIEAAKGSGVKVLPGMEVQTVEGVHMLCLFDDIPDALQLQEEVYRNLPDVPGASKFYEEQMIVDQNDEFVDYCRRPISVPTNLDIDSIFAFVENLGGLVIPSHIDRSGTGICDVLGMLPEEPQFEAVEISANISVEDARKRFPSVGNMPLIMNSDAHWLAAIGSRRTTFKISSRSVRELRMAFRGEEGREVVYA